MMKLLSFFFQVACIGLIIIGCNNISNPPEISNISNNNCVQNYNPNTDYFPDKATVKYARGFSVEYKNNYKIVTVKNPWKDAKTSFKYDYWEAGISNPDVVLSDLIKIFHPELLPNHQLFFYQKLD